MKDFTITHGTDIGECECDKGNSTPFATDEFHLKGLAIRINMDNHAHVA